MKEKSTTFRALIGSMKFKFSIMIFAVISLLIIFTIPLMRFNTDDRIPKLTIVEVEDLPQYRTKSFAAKVKTGLFIKTFPVFSIKNNEFVMDAVVWFEFNPEEVTLDTVGKFSFDYGNILKKSPPDVKLIGDKLFVKYNVRASLKTDLQFNKFPFEDHRLSIVLSNDFVTPEEMFFDLDASSFVVSDNLFISSWIFSGMNVDFGYSKLELDKDEADKLTSNPKALFIINLSKASIRKFMIIFIPIFAMAFFSLFSFLLNIENVVGRFSLAITAVTAILGYRFVIERIVPAVGYFTTTDEIYTLLLFFTFLGFIFQLLVTRHYMIKSSRKKTDEGFANSNLQLLMFRKHLAFLNSLFFIFMIFFLVVAVAYIVLKN